MISERSSCPRAVAAALAVALAAVALSGGACGNYSNEDLEFMNAVPERQDLSADLPARSAALAPADEAELAKATHDVTKVFNGILANILGGVEAIRAYQPTSRGPESRTWGPIPADMQPGWQWQFRMTRRADLGFDYWLELQPVGAAANAWILFLSGQFAPSAGVRRGVGELHVDTAALRAANYPFDADGAKMKTLDINYSTKDFPISVVMDFVTFPSLPDLTVTNTVHYEFGAQADGQGAMLFSLTSDLVTTTPALETLTVTSRWLASGAGRATAMITQGDGAGLTQTECWNDSFNATFNDKPWASSEDVPSDPPGDPSALCPAISTL